MAKSDKLKKLIRTLGGKVPSTDSISDCLDALCGCNIGGGGGSAGGSSGGGAFVFAPNFVYLEDDDMNVYRVKDEDRAALVDAVKNMSRIYAAYNGNSYGNWSNRCYELQPRLSANYLPNDDGEEEESGWLLRFIFVEYEREMSHEVEAIELTKEEYHEIYDAWNAMSNNAFLRPADAGMSGGGTHSNHE